MARYIIFLLFFLAGVSFWWYRSDLPETAPLVLEQADIFPVPADEVLLPSLDHARDTIPGLSERVFAGDNLVRSNILEDHEAYTRYSITYKSEGFTVSGVLLTPKGTVPPNGFPVLVLNHGYVNPETYTNGAALLREQDYFARHGYAILYSDYRDHALSDTDPGNEVRPRAGYVEDVLNLISAAENAGRPELDMDRLGMLGFSMGGGVTLNIMTAQPESARAYALLAPIHAEYRVNFDTWVKTEWPEVAEEFYQRYGTPEENPQFWHDISASNFFDRITRPVMLHQGTRDGEVPVAWSRELQANLEKAGVDITYYEYNEPHIFGTTGQNLALSRTLAFFDQHVKKVEQ